MFSQNSKMSQTTLSFDEKYHLITRNLHGIIGEDELKELLQQRDPIIYWGTAPTSSCHIGYLCPLLKIADFLAAGCTVKILIADLHALLDSLKSSEDVIAARSLYYETIIKETFSALSVNIDKLIFVKGTDFQLSKEYTMDVYRANSTITYNRAKHAGAQVVKQSDNPNINSLLYPTLQALDEEYLGVDIQFGGYDQVKIFMHSREIMPKLGYKKRIYLMNHMIQALSKFPKKVDTTAKKGEEKLVEKMSSSDPSSKIDLLDDEKTIKKKVGSAYCKDCVIDDNTPLVLVKTLLFSVLSILKKDFVINRPEQYGGPMTFTNFKDVEVAFENGSLLPVDLKLGIYDNLSNIMKPVREKFKEEGNKKILFDAYGI